MRDRGNVDKLLDALTRMVGMGGAVALVAAVLIGDSDVGLAPLYAALGLILASMVLVTIELYIALKELISSIATAVQLARSRSDARRLQRQRLLNSLAVEFGYASARGVSVRQAWDEAMARCFPGPGSASPDLVA